MNNPDYAAHGTNFIDILQRRATEQPQRRAYTFLVDGEMEELSLTYAELDRRVRIIGAWLHGRIGAGARALLLYPPGLDYITAFFGCLYAGVVAIPAYPPNPRQIERMLPRLQAIVRDARPALALTTQAIRSIAEAIGTQVADFGDLHWAATDVLPTADAGTWSPPALPDDSLAFLQYTSGSTSTPRGVMLSHRNLIHNSALIQHAFGHSSESQGVIWLPPYHDMGLIGGILQPLYSGFAVTLLSPVDFLQRPLRWLEAISRYRATTSGGPNFAYDLCIRKITPEQRERLDLSSWQVAFNGAEPIRAETLDRFAAAFALCGFRREAFYPCYGLAEATLIVSGGQPASPPVVRTVRATALAHNQVAEARGQESDARTLVGCGQVLPDQQVVIADPLSMSECPPDRVGEIWVSGPSTARGYWNRVAETAHTFEAYLADTGGGPFLRTGDLGAVLEGELFVTGRLKDLIIIRGHNYYPQDIELTVERSHAALRPGSGAAFSIEVAGHEQLVVVQEVDRQHRSPDVEAIAAAIRQAVLAQHDINAYAVVLARTGQIPKTSSGKIQRYACRERFLAGELEVVGKSVLDEIPDLVASEASLSREALLALASDERRPRMEAYLAQQAARSLRIPDDRLGSQHASSAPGLDSLAAAELQHRIERDLGVNIPLARFLDGTSVAGLAELALAQLGYAAHGTPVTPEATQQAVAEYALSYGQQALWFLHQLAPESAAYNIASCVRIQMHVDIPLLRRAFEALIDRHPALRATIEQRTIAGHKEPFQRIHPRGAGAFDLVDAAGWDETHLSARLVEEAYRAFDLERGPLMRVHVFRRSAQEHILLLVVHHIIADFWSLAVLGHELGVLYQAGQTGATASLAPPSLQYADYVSWQTAMLASPAGEQLWDYWRRQLADAPPVLNLPTDRPRPPVQSYHGASETVDLAAKLTHELRQLGQAHGATLYTTLLAAVHVLLHRYTAQEDILIGSPTTGRSHAGFAGVVGYFVNPLVLQADLSGNPTFAAFLGQVRQTVLAAIEHQDYPFSLLTKRMQPVRDTSRSPLFQVMFAFQKAPLLGDTDLTAFALGETGGWVDLGGLRVQPMALEQRAAQFDLMLTMAEVGGGLKASLQYDTALFDAATIVRLLGHFRSLLEAAVADPAQRVGDLPILTQAERDQLRRTWSATQTAYSGNMRIHDLFEDQVARQPDTIALVFDDTQLTYRELNSRANQLAHRLIKLGVAPEVRVGICVERSLELMVGLLGILKAGGAYLPLDPAYPAERLAFMLQDSRAQVLLTATNDQRPTTNDRQGDKGTRRGGDGESKTQNSTLNTQNFSSILHPPSSILDLYADWPSIAAERLDNPAGSVRAANLAYVIYTSGSSGVPKGVLIDHRSVINFFTGMDQRVGCGPADTLLAVTSVSFDISILELFWTLGRGARVVLMSEQALSGAAWPRPARPDRELHFSLFYFASADAKTARDKYRLLMEGAVFADRNGFAAVWTPERHFHAFGGLFSNPSVTGAALAAVTKRVQIRAGSVVLPLHDPIRVAEEWSIVDNLSNGRAGVAFASGWHADDFVFFPERFANRKEMMYRGIETIQQLWGGEAIAARGGAGNDIAVKIYPSPIQPTLPIWITAAGSPETFVKAGEIGAHVLTHLLGQTVDDVAERIRLYRGSLAQHGHDPRSGRVTLMLHTFIGEDIEAVREQVRGPFTSYLRSSIGLIENLIASLNLPLDLQTISPRDMDDLLAFAFDRYFETSALFGTPETVGPLIDQLKAIGVDEIACLIDFGVDVDRTLQALHDLNKVRERYSAPARRAGHSLAQQTMAYQPSLMQCTPSTMQMLALNPPVLRALTSLRTLMLGGEALPPSLAARIQAALPCRVLSMYGPTETTIWSMTHEVEDVMGAVPLGQPIANTQIHILDRRLQLAPAGVVGELYIGGDGLARGYYNRPDLTAERFMPNPFADQRPTTNDQRPTTAEDKETRGQGDKEPRPTTNDQRPTTAEDKETRGQGDKEIGQSPISNLQSPDGLETQHSTLSTQNSRLYKTGDLVRYRPDGTIEFLGRVDQQVKLRGFRIELGEIEALLHAHPAVHEAVVVVRDDPPNGKRLVAYIVPKIEDGRSKIEDRQADASERPSSILYPPSSLLNELRAFLKQRLPEYMSPSVFVILAALPLTANGKIDRQALPAPEGSRPELDSEYVAPRSKLEQIIATVWQQALALERVGVHDNFFDLGGHSLLMAQVHSQLQETLGREIPLIGLLEHPTISMLAKHLSQEDGAPPSFQSSQNRAQKQIAGLKRQRLKMKDFRTP